MKTTMKLTLAMLLAIVMLLSVVSCNDTKSPAESTSGQQQNNFMEFMIMMLHIRALGIPQMEQTEIFQQISAF